MTTSNRSELKIASISDIHLGHRRNTTAEIVANLRQAFPDNAETADLDIIFIAGDVFDDLLSYPDPDIAQIQLWIFYMLQLCKKHNILLRVLEGTPSHDWKQSEQFVNINTAAGIGANIQYVKDLSIEYIQEHDIHVLYVPDEWDTADKTLSQVHNLLRAKGLTHVDYAVMHGVFEFQLPPHVKAQKHNSADYLAIVRELIFIGHDHIFKQYERIIVHGSFDRLAHGEEGPKGHIRAHVRNGDRQIRFVETTNAKRFVTMSCFNLTLEETLEVVDKRVGSLPDGSHIRVEANADHPLFANMEVLIRRYPLLIWSKLPRDPEIEEHVVVEETVYVPMTITKDNLSPLLMERLANKNVTGEVLDAAKTILTEVL